MFDYEEQMPCSCKKTVCLITPITIVVLVTVFVALMSVFVPRRYSPPIQAQPAESQKLITFAFTIASYRGTSTTRENKSTIIRRVIEGFNSTEIIFAFELDDGKAIAIRQYNKNNSIATLEWLLQFQFINQNPNQNKMVTVYKEAISKNTHITHSYVFFAALHDDYRDTRNTIGSIASLKNTHNNSNKAMLIAPSEVIDIIYENDLCVIDMNKIRNEQAIDAIITYISSRGGQCPLEINRQSSSTGTKLPSEPSESTPSTTLCERFASIDIRGIGSKMSEQRRDLSEWEYLIFFIKSKNSPLRKWPIAKSRTKSLATSAGVVILSIIYITLMCIFLPGSPPSTTINPNITELNMFAFSIAQFKSLAIRQTRLSSDKSTIIKGIIEKLSSNATGFAFEVDNGEDAKIHQYANSKAAIAALDSLLQNVVDRNPNQTNAVAVYRRAMPNDQQIQHSYTFFAATPDDYAFVILRSLLFASTFI